MDKINVNLLIFFLIISSLFPLSSFSQTNGYEPSYTKYDSTWYFNEKINGNQLNWYARDTKALVLAPLKWKAKDYAKIGIAATIAFVLVKKVDGPVKDYFRDNRTDTFFDKVSVSLNPYKGYSYVLLAGVVPYVAGAITKSNKLKRTSFESLEAQLLTTVISYPLNIITNRIRPRDGGQPSDFAPFEGTNGDWTNLNTSMPSGHTILVFSAATVFAEAYKDKPWVGIMSYTMAGLVGVERLWQKAHFVSDVFIGAFIGHYMAKRIMKLHKPFYRNTMKKKTKTAHLNLSPFNRYGASGMSIKLRF